MEEERQSEDETTEFYCCCSQEVCLQGSTKDCKKLNDADRIKVELRPNMSVPQVKAAITHAFQHLPNISGYTLLIANQSGFLALVPYQALNGNSIIDQVGQRSLYLCQEYVDPKVCVIHFMVAKYMLNVVLF